MQLYFPFIHQVKSKEPEQLSLYLEIDSPPILDTTKEENQEQMVVIELF
jgi:hypothetical protein